MQNKDLPQGLKTVLTQQTMAVFGNKTAQALNDEFLSCHGNSLPHIHAGKTFLIVILYSLTVCFKVAILLMILHTNLTTR